MLRRVVCCLYKYHQDKMSLLHQHGLQTQMWPAVGPIQNTRKAPGFLNGPQNTACVEAQMAQQARLKIQARLKMAMWFQQYRAQPSPNQHGVTVTSDPASTQDKICLTVHKNKKVVPFTVRNFGVQPVYLTCRTCDFVENIFTITDCDGNIIRTVTQHILWPGEAYQIKVHFCSGHAGFYEQLLVFHIETHQQPSEKFTIMRLLEVIRRTSVSEELSSTPIKSLCEQETVKTRTEGLVLMLLEYVVSLKRYAMPDTIKDFKKSDTDLQKPLNWKNYAQRFHLLLHLEELQLKTEFDKCFQKSAPLFRLKSNTDLVVMPITNVCRNAPLRLSGNQVLVTPLDQGVFESNMYRGWVHHVDAEKVYLKLGEKFLSEFSDGLKFSVTFLINRIPLRMQHRAAALVYRYKLKEVLFPTGRISSHNSHLPSLELENNPEQCMAIQHIAAGSAKPAPYLVFGPPGTGKTVTLVGAIKQIVETQPSCKILACAPSNTATDHLCERILEGITGKHKVYRLYALGSSVKNILKNTKLSCNVDIETNTFMIPSKGELMKYTIMVTTLLTAGRLVTGGIPPGHYTYIVVDEAGQAAESECIVPIAGLLKPKTCQVVLAGDPKQLGPIITSRMAEKHCMDVSLLERLMRDINLYKSDETNGYNNRFVTKLLRNYRSHPAILKIPNELFYEGQLQPYANRDNCNLYCKWERLPKKGFPLIFHGVAGSDEREANSPSVYNMAEVEVLKEYLKSLIDHLRKKGVSRIELGEIGIISPYRKQVERIQNALQMDKDLQKENLENILVGSVEQFQGKEFNVILVSTVRSNPKLTVQKQQFTLGFVNNEKRFNVAMTRARSLLIVVGDPRLLKTDQIWNKFIHYCYMEGGYRGITVSDAKEELLTNVHSQSLWEE